jgi:transposase
MDSLIVLMSQHMTVTAIAEMIDEHDTRIWRVLEYYVAEASALEHKF